MSFDHFKWSTSVMSVCKCLSACVFFFPISCYFTQLLSEEVDKVSSMITFLYVYVWEREKTIGWVRTVLSASPLCVFGGTGRRSMSCVLLRQSLTDRQRLPDCCWRGSAARMWVCFSVNVSFMSKHDTQRYVRNKHLTSQVVSKV